MLVTERQHEIDLRFTVNFEQLVPCHFKEPVRLKEGRHQIGDTSGIPYCELFKIRPQEIELDRVKLEILYELVDACNVILDHQAVCWVPFFLHIGVRHPRYSYSPDILIQGYCFVTQDLT